MENKSKPKTSVMEEVDDGEISDDDLDEENNDETWFGMEMTRVKKIETRRPWRYTLIVKLMGSSIGYHYLWR